MTTRAIALKSSCSKAVALNDGATRSQGRCADLKQMVHGMIDVVAAPYARS